MGNHRRDLLSAGVPVRLIQAALPWPVTNRNGEAGAEMFERCRFSERWYRIPIHDPRPEDLAFSDAVRLTRPGAALPRRRGRLDRDRRRGQVRFASDGTVLVEALEEGGRIADRNEARRDGLYHRVELSHQVVPGTVRLHTSKDGTAVLTRWIEITNSSARPVAPTALAAPGSERMWEEEAPRVRGLERWSDAVLIPPGVTNTLGGVCVSEDSNARER